MNAKETWNTSIIIVNVQYSKVFQWCNKTFLIACYANFHLNHVSFGKLRATGYLIRAVNKSQKARSRLVQSF